MSDKSDKHTSPHALIHADQFRPTRQPRDHAAHLPTFDLGSKVRAVHQGLDYGRSP
jgi:hypothetical protein